MKNKGITLVALVITIIILLILAGISISALTNQGLFKQAQNAKNLTEEKTAEENEILTNYLEQMNAIIGGQVTESIPDGAVVTPVNDITTWLKTGGISKQYSYTTIEQVIADTTCTESLMNNENAMKYLARSTEFADTICSSETAMTYLGQSAYVDGTVLNSDIWLDKIGNSNRFDKIFYNLIPTMTSNTTPSGTVTASSVLSENGTVCDAYQAFDNKIIGTHKSSWIPADGATDNWIQYTFNENVKVYKIEISMGGSYDVAFTNTVTLDGYTGTAINYPKRDFLGKSCINTGGVITNFIKVSNSTRMQYSGSWSLAICEIYVYGRNI